MNVVPAEGSAGLRSGGTAGLVEGVLCNMEWCARGVVPTSKQ